MSIDLTGGLGEDREFVLATQPDDPEMRESVNIWVWDDGDDVGINLQQAIVRYTWDGERANGMLERSMPTAALES